MAPLKQTKKPVLSKSPGVINTFSKECDAYKELKSWFIGGTVSVNATPAQIRNMSDYKHLYTPNQFRGAISRIKKELGLKLATGKSQMFDDF